MARTIGIGQQDFADIRRDKLFYIDKTKFIKEWWESKDSVTLITRPRRFGKTLNSVPKWYYIRTEKLQCIRNGGNRENGF